MFINLEVELNNLYSWIGFNDFESLNFIRKLFHALPCLATTAKPVVMHIQISTMDMPSCDRMTPMYVKVITLRGLLFVMMWAQVRSMLFTITLDISELTSTSDILNLAI